MSRQPAKEKSLESWIWDAACSSCGAKDAPKFKDYILPLIFTKRLCDAFDDELDWIAKEVGSSTKLGVVKVGIPPTVDEQKEITLAFATTEQKILVEMSKKNQLQDLFHTLLHQLMTAKFRVEKIAMLQS